MAFKEKMRVTANQCDQQGYCLHPRSDGVSRRQAQGGVGAAEKVGVCAGQAHRSEGKDHQRPSDKSICAAAEGAICSPAEQDPVPTNTSNWGNPMICISFEVLTKQSCKQTVLVKW